MAGKVTYLQAHCHSRYSINRLSGEGVFNKIIWPIERQFLRILMSSPEHLKKLAEKNGIRFVAVTDHNTLPPIAEEDDTLIASEEWGQTKGHANFISLGKPIDPECGFFKNKAPENPKNFFEATSDAKKQGAFVSINHPFKRDAWLWGDESYNLANALEIWNGEWNEENLRALRLWQELLVKGSRIWCFSGNDFHVNHLYKINSQVIALMSATNKISLLENLKDGRFSIARDVHSPVVFLLDNLYYKIENYTDNLNLRTVSATRSLEESNPNNEGRIETRPDDKFIRLELWKENLPLSFTNPIFL